MNGLSDVEVFSGLGYANTVESQNNLLGLVQKMGPARASRAMAQIKTPSAGSKGQSARDQVLSRISALPQDIQNGIISKRLQIVETELYSTKYITSATQQNFFEDADTVNPGYTNVNNAKLKKDEWFLLLGVQFLTGVGASATVATAAIWDAPAASQANGDFDLLANGNKYMLPERTPISIFSDVASSVGGYKNKVNCFGLDNPKWFEPQVKFGATMRFAAADATANLWGRLKLVGASIISY